MDPIVLKNPDPGDAHLCVDFFRLVGEILVVGSLWTYMVRPAMQEEISVNMKEKLQSYIRHLSEER